MKQRLFFRSWWRLQNYQSNARRKSLKNPPPSYIGTQVSLLSDPDYLVLGAAERGHLHGMLLLAAMDGGHIPAEPKRLAACLRLHDEIDLSIYAEWLQPCEGECEHYPKGFDSKGNRRRAHGVGTPSGSDPDKGKEKGKEKGKRSSTRASSKAPISPEVGETKPGDDDALESQSSVALEPTGAVESVLRYAEAQFPTFRRGSKDPAVVGKMLENSPASTVHSAITLAKARCPDVKPKSMAYFSPLVEELNKAGPGYAEHVSRCGPKRLEEIAQRGETP